MRNLWNFEGMEKNSQDIHTYPTKQEKEILLQNSLGRGYVRKPLNSIISELDRKRTFGPLI